MKIFNRKTLVAAMAIASSATIISLANLSHAAPELSVNTSNGIMQVSSDSGAQIYVRIAGPNGYFKELRGSSLTEWNPGPDAPDGSYRYDSYSTLKVPQGTMSKSEWSRIMQQNSTQSHGGFTVENGVMIPNQLNSSAAGPQSRNDSDNLLLNAITSMLDVLIPTAHALDLTASSTQPGVLFEDTDVAVPLIYQVRAGQVSQTENDFYIWDQANSQALLYMRSVIGSTDAVDSLTVGLLGQGDIGLADNTVYIDKSAKALGIGTTTPSTDMHILGSGLVELSLQTTAASAPRWELEATDGWININQDDSSGKFFVFKDSDNATLSVGSEAGPSGNVGIGTTIPESTLHIKKADAVLTVEDTTAGGVSNIIELKRPGSVGFSMENTTLGEAWDFRTAGNGGFLVSNIGVPGSKFQINLDGRVFLGGGVFDLKPDGNMTLTGNSTALAHISTSSREVKTDFAKVDPKAVMAKIKDMEVSEWRYKDKAAKGRHIGPVAEDFYSLFKLGADNKHIAASDMASIALIAAKELQKKSDRIESENLMLKKRLQALEKLVTNLASGQGIFPATGASVALSK